MTSRSQLSRPSPTVSERHPKAISLERSLRAAHRGAVPDKGQPCAEVVKPRAFTEKRFM